MRKEFFDSARPGRSVTHGKAAFELPILYFRDDFFALFFTASLQKIKELMPSDKLHPVMASGNRSLLGIGVYNYIDTSIGPYGEIGVVVPVVHGKHPLPFLPALLESRYPNFGVLVLHLPVTTIVARDAGRAEWGYTKFIADMHFTSTPEFMECRMDEEDKHIMTVRVAREGMIFKDRKPLVTYSVKDKNLIKTTVAHRGVYRKSFFPSGSFLNLGDHPVAESIRNLELSHRPLQTRYSLERSAILPSGKVIEQGVKPLDGYFGKDRAGQHTVAYLE